MSWLEQESLLSIKNLLIACLHQELLVAIQKWKFPLFWSQTWRWNGPIVVLNGPGMILFAYSLALVFDTRGFAWQQYLSDQSLGSFSMVLICMLGKKNVLFCAILFKVVKFQVISSCSEQNILSLVDKMF